MHESGGVFKVEEQAREGMQNVCRRCRGDAAAAQARLPRVGTRAGFCRSHRLRRSCLLRVDIVVWMQFGDWLVNTE